MTTEARILVTGATGFLGNSIARLASRQGMRVRALGRGACSPCAEVEYFRGDITDPESLGPVIDNVDCVIHAAGLAHQFRATDRDAERFTAVNEVGTANVVNASMRAGVRHLILVSSVAVYGRSVRNYDENVPCRPKGPYGTSKWHAELRAQELVQPTDARLTILRLATLYGEGDPGNVARLIRAVDRGRFVWLGDGSNRKSLLHRDDAARACLAALAGEGTASGIYNVSGEACTMREVVEEISLALGRRTPRWGVPRGIVQCIANARWLPSQRLRSASITLRKWLSDDVYDGTRFQQDFGFRPQVTLHEGMSGEVDWYRSVSGPGRR